MIQAGIGVRLQLAANHAKLQKGKHSATQPKQHALPGAGRPLTPIELEILSCFEAYDENAE